MSGASTGLCHGASAEVAVPATVAMAYMCDGLSLGEWSLGCWDTRRVEDGLYVGKSLFDGGETWVRIVAEDLAITYHVGWDRDHLVPRIMVLVVPGPATDRAPDHCVVTMLTWRGRDASDERWHRVAVTHETEILLIKARLERAG